MQDDELKLEITQAVIEDAMRNVRDFGEELLARGHRPSMLGPRFVEALKETEDFPVCTPEWVAIHMNTEALALRLTYDLYSTKYERGEIDSEVLPQHISPSAVQTASSRRSTAVHRGATSMNDNDIATRKLCGRRNALIVALTEDDWRMTQCLCVLCVLLLATLVVTALLGLATYAVL